ncbi:WUSCHEL-related homeobox 4-like [Cryptomeria japonica]|uniref:WUSCHEL-related homeobox 4-like n=1 Tax=Cryptomeria japonica TaxID=3369 RepID=UPI0025ACAC75|nr:WUSCHEL-related homeobox 4-like [Cryptomeria japonica]
MDRGSASDSRVIKTSRWKATDNQRRILEYLFASGTRNPCLEEIERISADLQGHGPVQGKNVFYWFQNATAREKRMKKSSSRLPSVLKARNWSSEKSYAQEEEDRRYSSVDPSDLRTFELFPLHPGL